MRDAGLAQYVILITDGEPNCNPCDYRQNAACTIAEIQAAAGQSPPVKTFVVGFGYGISVSILNRMACAGTVPAGMCSALTCAQTKCYYSPMSQAELTAALGTILRDVAATCP